MCQVPATRRKSPLVEIRRPIRYISAEIISEISRKHTRSTLNQQSLLELIKVFNQPLSS